PETKTPPPPAPEPEEIPPAGAASAVPEIAEADAEADAEAAAAAAPAAEEELPPIPRAERELRATATVFFQSLIAGVPEAAAELTDFPFNLDGEILKSRSALVERLERALERADLSRMTFYGVLLMPSEMMLARHGPPPRRMGELQLEGRWVGIANLGGHGYVAVFEKQKDRWVVTAYTD
ncbi:MAG: hypothetical protein P1V51_24320, partial [Deltaproteobacteria bacterium]|nr:hypothetical protein [Deltaproteobacteria bacterium]